MDEAEVFDTILTAHERWVRIVHYEIMQMLDRLGLPCETWEEAEEMALWLIGEGLEDNEGE